MQIHARSKQCGDNQNDVGLGAGQHRGSHILIQIVEAADGEIGELHQAIADDQIGQTDGDKQRWQAALEAGFPELVCHQRHDNQTEAVQVVAVIELHPQPVIKRCPGHRQQPSIHDNAHCHADQEQGEEPVAAKKVAPFAEFGEIFGI